MTANKPKLGAWTPEENEIIALSYLDMLRRELRGDKFNKAANRREGLATMALVRADNAERSHGSWEMKCCNVSAVMRAAGLPWVNGYKPLGHGQAKPLATALACAALAHGWDDNYVIALEKAAR